MNNLLQANAYTWPRFLWLCDAYDAATGAAPGVTREGQDSSVFGAALRNAGWTSATTQRVGAAEVTPELLTDPRIVGAFIASDSHVYAARRLADDTWGCMESLDGAVRHVRTLAGDVVSEASFVELVRM